MNFSNKVSFVAIEFVANTVFSCGVVMWHTENKIEEKVITIAGIWRIASKQQDYSQVGQLL